MLLINLHGDTVGFKVQLDSAAIAKEVANILEERIEGEEIVSGGERERGGGGGGEGGRERERERGGGGGRRNTSF